MCQSASGAPIGLIRGQSRPSGRYERRLPHLTAYVLGNSTMIVARRSWEPRAADSVEFFPIPGKLGMHRPMSKRMPNAIAIRRGTVTIIAVAVCMAAFASSCPVRAVETAIVCTNPASGATWQILVDYDKRTVDSYPARVDDTKISWHDAKDGGNYTLDRDSGKLTVIVASSTGGYFLHDRCKPRN